LTLAASSRGNGRVLPTPSTSARRSTSTPAASSRGSARISPTSSTSAHRSTPTWRSTSTPLVASVCVNDHSSSTRDCTSTSSAVPCLRMRLCSFDACLMLGIIHRQVLLVL
jgi:hypothetical protein